MGSSLLFIATDFPLVLIPSEYASSERVVVWATVASLSIIVTVTACILLGIVLNYKRWLKVCSNVSIVESEIHGRCYCPHTSFIDKKRKTRKILMCKNLQSLGVVHMPQWFHHSQELDPRYQ